MADPILKTLPELTAAGVPATTDLIPIYQGANPLKKLTWANAGAYLPFLQAGTGAESRPIASKLKELKSFTDFDGVVPVAAPDQSAGANVTAAMQAVLDACPGCDIYLPPMPDGSPAYYMIDAGSSDTSNSGTGPTGRTVTSGALQPASKTRIFGPKNAILKCRNTTLGTGSALFLFEVDGVTIEGITIEGDKDTHLGATGESLAGIAMWGCSNTLIRDVTCTNWWGDGATLTCSAQNLPSTNTVIENCQMTDNGRNSLSIIHADGYEVRGGLYNTATRTLPKAGIDVEPNPGQYCRDGLLIGLTADNNTETGILVAPQSSSSARGEVSNLKIIGCSATGSKVGFGVQADSISFTDSMQMSSCYATNNTEYDYYIRNTKNAVFKDCVGDSVGSLQSWYIRGEFAAGRLILNSSTGTFAYGETITGGTSGATAVIMVWQSNVKQLQVRAVTGTFSASETITGGTSGATGVVRGGLINEPPSFSNVFDGCQGFNSASTGFYIDTTSIRNRFVNCMAANNVSSGMRLLTQFNTVENCELRYNGNAGLQLGAVSAGADASYSVVRGNRIYANVTSGLSVSGATVECLISENFVRSGGVQTSGIVMASTSGYNRLVNNDYTGGGTSANLTLTDTTTILRGNFNLQANNLSGSAVLVAGTVTVTNTQIQAASNVVLSVKTIGGTPGTLSLGAIVAGTSFVINSSSGTDTSTVTWQIIS